MTLSESQRFALSELNETWFGTSTVRRRQFDAQLVSMHNSGSHWLKYSLSVGMALVYGQPLPEHIQSDRLIGHPKSLPEAVPGMPCIVHSHSIANRLLWSRPARALMRFPRYLVLVRGIEDSLFSTYIKWRESYGGMAFREFVHDGLLGKGRRGGLWHEIIFYNAWGAVLARYPQHSCLIRYEDLQADWETQYRRAWDFLGLEPIGDDQLAQVKHLSSKSEMAKKPNPRVKQTVVRQDQRKAQEIIEPQDLAFIHQQMANYIRYPLGYR